MPEVIRQSEDFQKLKEQWNNLPQAARSPLLRHEWFESCLNSLHKEEQLYTIILRTDDQLMGAMPLAVTRRKTGEWLELMGTSTLGEPCDLLFEDTEKGLMLFKYLASQGYPFLLPRIPYNSHFLEQAAQRCNKKGIFFCRQATPSLAVECNGTWQEYYSTISSRRRYDHRRAKKRAETMGEITYEDISPSPENIETILHKAFLIEAAGWKGEKGSALLINHKLRSFFQHYSRLTAKSNMLRVFFLNIGGQPAAMQICLLHDGRVWVMKIGFDEQWSKCSPGILLMYHCIKYAFIRNMKSYEFLGSSEPWLQIWANKKRRFANIIFYPFSFQGMKEFSFDMTRVFWEKATRS